MCAVVTIEEAVNSGVAGLLGGVLEKADALELQIRPGRNNVVAFSGARRKKMSPEGCVEEAVYWHRVGVRGDGIRIQGI